MYDIASLVAPAPASAPPSSATALAPYTGPWTDREAAHLLRRATLGVSYARIQEAVQSGRAATVANLLAERPLPDPPEVVSPLDGGADVGETWVDKPYSSDNLMRSVVARIGSLFGWLGGNMLLDDDSAHETMQLFWHNHFAINTAVEPKYNYRYLVSLRTHAFGSFRQLVKEMTIDPLMLTFLNGNQNRAAAPNENYARELLELFTIGKGPQVGDGDYTTYTEQDVREMARVLTGWRDFGFNSTTSGEFGSSFFPNRHDATPKTLSARFGNQTITFSGETAYAQLVDLILERPEVARFMVRKFYRWFVYYDISPEVEATVIEPLATLFRESDYEVRPVLERLLNSNHFFDILSQGPMIRHPYDFLIGTLRALGVEPAIRNVRQRYNYGNLVQGLARDLEMTYFTPPNVAGWKAYYQEPLYYRIWINSATLQLRKRMTDGLLDNGLEIRGIGNVPVDLVGLIQQFPNPANLNDLVDNLSLLLFPRPLTQEQVVFLKELIIPGLPDTQWTTEYLDFQASPNDETLRAALETKLRRCVRAMLTMPEYQLS